MRCKACGTENESYMEFCRKCAEELPRENPTAVQTPSAPVQPNNMPNIAFDEFEPQPYDYRLPYRPSRGFPEGYERPKASENAPRRAAEAPPRPSPSYEPPVRPVPRMSAQLPPIPEPQERTFEAPIVRISDVYVPQQQPVQQPVQQPAPPVQQPVQPVQYEASQKLPVPVPLPAVPQTIAEPSEAVNDKDEELTALSGERRHKKRRQGPPSPPKKSRRQRDYDDDYEDDDDYDERPQKGGALMVVLYISIAVLLLAAVWFAGNYINTEYGSVANFIDDVFGTGEPEDPTASPLDTFRVEVQPGTHEGQPVQEITFYGKSGQTIELPNIGVQQLSQTFKIDEGASYVPIKAPNVLFIPEEPAEDTPEGIPVKLEANLIDVDGQIYPLDVPEFTVPVPQATLTLSQPAAAAVTLEEPTLTLAGKVSTDARLFIDGSDASGIIDQLGNFNYAMEIPEYGDRTIVLEVKALYQRPQKITLEVSYPKREVPITVEGAVPSAADPYMGVLEGTQDETIEVRGTFEAGAQVTIEGALEDEPSIDSGSGVFSFTGLLESTGLNAFTIRAAKDGAESGFRVSVEKKPDLDEYTGSARTMDYESLSEHAEDQIERIYICKGTITEFIQDAPYPIFIFNVGDEDGPQNIVMEYYGTIALDTTQEYRMYGDVAGMDAERGLPKLFVRFIYEE